MKNHHIVLIAAGALALLYVYGKKNAAPSTSTVTPTAQQASVDPAFWNYAGSWQV